MLTTIFIASFSLASGYATSPGVIYTDVTSVEFTINLDSNASLIFVVDNSGLASGKYNTTGRVVSLVQITVSTTGTTTFEQVTASVEPGQHYMQGFSVETLATQQNFSITFDFSASEPVSIFVTNEVNYNQFVADLNNSISSQMSESSSIIVPFLSPLTTFFDVIGLVFQILFVLSIFVFPIVTIFTYRKRRNKPVKYDGSEGPIVPKNYETPLHNTQTPHQAGNSLQRPQPPSEQAIFPRQMPPKTKLALFNRYCKICNTGMANEETYCPNCQPEGK